MSAAATNPIDVAALTAPMQAVHDSCVNYSFEWRRTQLVTLGQMLTNHWDEWAEALRQDLGKCRVEAVAMEILMVKTDLDYTLKHLKEWMQPEMIASPFICIPAFSKHVSRPLTGPAVLVIGPSNYPVSLVFHPIVGALAAGNPVVCKPSELTPSVEALFARLVPLYFDPSVMACVTGGIPETTALLQHAWGRIFFTGSGGVGKLVATAAASTLTPVTLELGGKAPCYIDAETCPLDVTLMCHRILWSKTVNAGQTCAATDTLIVHESQLPTLIPILKKSLHTMFGVNPRESDFGRIVSPRHAQRLIDMIAQVEASMDDKTTKILTGGSQACDAAARYVAPTIIVNPPSDSRVMVEEIFGPILPIVTVASRADAIQYMRQMKGTPLCLYVFTSSDQVFTEIVQQIPSGSVIRNDCLVHLCSPYISFGGLGSSGYGGYHGKFSFDLFSHKQPIMYRPCLPGMDFGMLRYHPFDKLKGYLVTDVAVVMPSIPVLRLPLVFRTLVVVAGTVLLGHVLPPQYTMQNPFLARTVWEPLAQTLEQAAQWLRERTQ